MNKIIVFVPHRDYVIKWFLCIISWYLVGVWFILETFVVFLVSDLVSARASEINNRKYITQNPIISYHRILWIIHWISMIWQNFNFHFAAINCQLVSQRHINCYLSDSAGTGVNLFQQVKYWFISQTVILLFYILLDTIILSFLMISEII